MVHLVRLIMLVAVVGGGLALVAQLRGGDGREAGGAAAATTDPTRSSARLTHEEEWSVVRYEVAADEAIIVRMSDAGMTTCNFNVHEGPRVGRDRIKRHLAVEYEFAPFADWRDSVARMAGACAHYWFSVD